MGMMEETHPVPKVAAVTREERMEFYARETEVEKTTQRQIQKHSVTD